jgi:hypothetical protein
VFKTVMVLAIAVSVIGLVAGMSSVVQTPAYDELGVPAHAVPVERQQHDEVDAASERLGRVTAVAKPKSDGVCVSVYADGVRVRSAPSLTGAVLGLAYYGDSFRYTGNYGTTGDWQEGTLLRTGVRGWINTNFLNLSFEDC